MEQTSIQLNEISELRRMLKDRELQIELLSGVIKVLQDALEESPRICKCGSCPSQVRDSDYVLQG